MLVKFLQSRTVKAVDGESFIEGREYDLPTASAERWIRRGLAVAVVKSIDAPPTDKSVKGSPRKKNAAE